MYKSLEVKNDIYWVGALDFDIKIFDVVMETNHGATYNSYVVKGTEKTVLFEIVKETFFDEFFERLTSIVKPEEIDYIVVSHAEPDHSGSLKLLLEYCPNAVVLGTQGAMKFTREITNFDFEKIIVKDGHTLDIGGKTLEFFTVPNLHWPDTMFTYIKESKTLFSCDSFGSHYCDENVFSDLIEGDFSDNYKYYYDCIMSPFKQNILSAINKIKELDIETICGGHGPVLRENVQYYIDKYKEWSTITKLEVPKIVICYVTSYGYTKKLADSIKNGVQSVGKIDVSLYNLVEDDLTNMWRDIEESSGILIGSPTILADTLPPIWDVLKHLNPVMHKGKLAGVFGSYGWSGEAFPNIEARLHQLKLQMPVPTLKILFNPSEEQLESAFNYGVGFGSEIIK